MLPSCHSRRYSFARNLLMTARTCRTAATMSLTVLLSIASDSNEAQPRRSRCADHARRRTDRGDVRGTRSPGAREHAQRRSRAGERSHLQAFLGERSQERRRKLMPFFWGTLMSEHGSIAGNQALGSSVRLTNRHWFSYPGTWKSSSARRTTTRSRATIHCEIHFLRCSRDCARSSTFRANASQRSLHGAFSTRSLNTQRVRLSSTPDLKNRCRVKAPIERWPCWNAKPCRPGPACASTSSRSSGRCRTRWARPRVLYLALGRRTIGRMMVATIV